MSKSLYVRLIFVSLYIYSIFLSLCYRVSQISMSSLLSLPRGCCCSPPPNINESNAMTRWLLYLLLLLMMLQRQSDQFVVSVSRFLRRDTLKDVALQLRHIRARRITLVASQVVRFHNLFRPGIVPSSGHRHRFEEIDKKVVVRKSVPMLFGR